MPDRGVEMTALDVQIGCRLPPDLISTLSRIEVRLHEVAKRRLRRKADVIAAQIEKRMAVIFVSEGRAFLRLFARLEDRFPETEIQEAILGDDEWVRLLVIAQSVMSSEKRGVLKTGISGAMALGGQGLLNEMGLGVQFSLSNPRAAQYVAFQGAKLVSQIDETTRNYIRTVITKGTSEGWSYNRMADEITARYKEFAVGRPQLHIESRAHLIAVTETAAAYEEGNAIVGRDLQQGGLLMEKSWLTVGDNRVSAACQSNQDAGWIPLDSEFPSGHKNPPEHPSCRCTTLYQRVGAA